MPVRCREDPPRCRVLDFLKGGDVCADRHDLSCERAVAGARARQAALPAGIGPAVLAIVVDCLFLPCLSLAVAIPVDCGLRAGSPGGNGARVRSPGRARCGVSRRRRLLAPVGGSLRDLPRRLLAGPHAPARGRTADTEGTCQQDRRITAGLYHQRCPAQRYRRAATELKTFMLRSPPASLVPDPDLSWDRKREPPTEVVTVPFVRHCSAFLARLEWEIYPSEDVRLILETGGNVHERRSPPRHHEPGCPYSRESLPLTNPGKNFLKIF